MLRGLTTVTYLAGDVAAAVDWYTGLLGVGPYFSRPADGRLAYAEFRVGDYQHELGILDRRFAAPGRRTRPAARSSTGTWTTSGPASGGCWPWVRPRTRSRSSADPDSSPRRSSTRSATCSA
jgi:catechol 2,3-dioxygenase-like lactoylglutathione lyase family enzyme